MTEREEEMKVESVLIRWVQPILSTLIVGAILYVGSQIGNLTVSIAEIKKDVAYLSRTIEDMKKDSKDLMTLSMFNEKMAVRDRDILDLQRRMLFVEKYRGNEKSQLEETQQ